MHIIINVGAALATPAGSLGNRRSKIGSAKAIIPRAHGIPIIMLVLIPKLTLSFTSLFCPVLKAPATAGTTAIATACVITCGKPTIVLQYPDNCPHSILASSIKKPPSTNLLVTNTLSTAFIKGKIDEPIVIGTAIIKICLIIFLLLSRLLCVLYLCIFWLMLFLLRKYISTITNKPAMEPAVAPKVAPAAAISKD